jgi:phosphoglycolate phosphatase
MALKGLLFDKDGTLIDFDRTWGPACYEVMCVLTAGDRQKLEALMRINHFEEAERRLRPTSPMVAGSSADYGPMWAEALGREAGPDFFGEMDSLFEVSGLKSLAPIHGPDEVAAALKAKGLALGLVTNDSERSGRIQAEVLGIASHLDFYAGYDSGFGPKPAPGMVTAFIERLGCTPSEVAVVGDSLHDLHCAKAAGAVAILVLTGPRGEAARTELEAHADHVITSIAELPDLVDRL